MFSHARIQYLAINIQVLLSLFYVLAGTTKDAKRIIVDILYILKIVFVLLERKNMKPSSLITQFGSKPVLEGAVCGVINHHNKILLLRRDNIPTITYPDYWAAPGGKVEIFETPERAIRRELNEELGLDISTFHYLTSVINPQNNAKDHVFLAYVQAECADIHRGEGCDHRFFTREEILQLDKVVPHTKGFVASVPFKAFSMSSTPTIMSQLSLRNPNLF